MRGSRNIRNTRKCADDFLSDAEDFSEEKTESRRESKKAFQNNSLEECYKEIHGLVFWAEEMYDFDSIIGEEQD